MEWDWELGGADFGGQIGEERMEVRRQKSEDSLPRATRGAIKWNRGEVSVP
jgi:hypothetical protein